MRRGLVGRSGRIAGAMLAAWLLCGCGGEDGGAADAGAVEDVDASGDGGDGGGEVADAGDTGPAGSLKWTAAAPAVAGKMLAAAIVPGQPGSYIVVGEDGALVEVVGSQVTVRAPAGIGKPTLRGVWVDGQGEGVAVGSGSSIISGKGEDWELVAAIPPTPPAQFRAVAGDAGEVWAVGDNREAWRRDGAGVWAPAAVSVTEGEALAADDDFLAVAVGGGGVWIGVDRGQAGGALLERAKGGWRAIALPLAPASLWRAPGGAVWLAGGATTPWVARWDGEALVEATGLQWQQRFTCVGGHADDVVWAGAGKGQVRAWDGKAWSVVEIKAPPGTPKPFAAPSGDVSALAGHGAQEWLVVTPNYLYRYGIQP